MDALSYDETVAANIRAVRALRRLDQAVIVKRMRALGFTSWHRQTLGKVERGERRLLGPEEILGLAKALETTVGVLMKPADEDGWVRFPSGAVITARSVALSVLAYNDRSVAWDGDQPGFTQGEDDITAQVVIRPRWLAGPSSVDPADIGPEPLGQAEEKRS